MFRTALVLLLVCVVYSMTHAQAVKGVKGYLCKNIDASVVYSVHNPYALLCLRTGNRVESYRLVIFPTAMQTTRHFNHALPPKDRIGTEYLVKYKAVDGEKQAISVSKTGRVKKVKPCVEE